MHKRPLAESMEHGVADKSEEAPAEKQPRLNEDSRSSHALTSELPVLDTFPAASDELYLKKGQSEDGFSERAPEKVVKDSREELASNCTIHDNNSL
eukprot:CAMPEP_0182422308 /NCGR_PEP_ID=MMETSP1167-20130531/7957_1 /TAXON_ID=2988 /ORGANISM="Mallomonas Sp, Strain CCMP3275" /LENGTH=95 /DNA_ID=CAMNT_0024600253 /DNA_START=248 /DNA_END=535 /DNA_ORIENTATION=-